MGGNWKIWCRGLLLACSLSSTLWAVHCFEPIYCKGGTPSTCLEQCLGLSDKLVASPGLSVSHPECLIGCDESCTKLCGGESTAEQGGATPPLDEDESATVQAGPVGFPAPRPLGGHVRPSRSSPNP